MQELVALDNENCLNQAKRRLGKYGWMLPLLKVRAAQTGGRFPSRLHRILSRFVNPAHSYFFGQVACGVSFVGDYRDGYSTNLAISSGRDPLGDFISARLKEREGAYLDIGANLGVLASTIAKNSNHDVVAFEPITETAQRAAATFALNGLKGAKVYVCAVGDEDGDLIFFDAPGHSDLASASPGKTATDVSWHKTRVPCRTLDSLKREAIFDRVSLIKVDVEGFEPKVLLGASNIIRDEAPNIVYEYNYDVAPRLGNKPGDISPSLTQSSYQFYTLKEDCTLAAFPPPEIGSWVVNIFCQHKLST